MSQFAKLSSGVAVAVLMLASAITPAPAAGWLGAWTGDPAGPTGVIPAGTRTLREIISPRVSGNQLRLTLTNKDGVAPVTFTQVYVGVQKYAAYVAKGTNKQLTFSGSKSVTIPAGKTVVSDPMSFPVVSFQKLAISMEATPGTIPALSQSHPVSRELNYFSPLGTADAENGFGYQTFTLTQGVLFQASWHYINQLDVYSMNIAPRVVVSFGDSITDGLQVNTPLQNTFIENIKNLGLEQRYEDYIQKIVVAKQGYSQFSFVNAGIAGNRLTAGPFAPFFGPAGVDRLATDVFGVPGATDAIIGLGINDIAFDIPAQAGLNETIVKTIENDLTIVMKKMIAHKIRPILTTILPALGAEASQAAPVLQAVPGLPTPINGGVLHGTAISDKLRREVNAWILTGPGKQMASAVVDLSACMEDPAKPGHLNAIYDSGDHLHPNAAGYAHMADCTPIATTFGAVAGAAK